MGTKGDLAALEDVIDRLDTMLSQVLIEAVILEIGLNKNIEYGIDWLQRSMTVNNNTTAGGVTVREPVYAFGGGQNLNATTFKAGDSVTRDTSLGSGLTYFTTIFDLNIDAVIRMVASSSDAKILSTPVILTTDNTEAKIVVGEERPVVTSTSTSTAGQQTSAYEYRSIGINLTVTPRINPQRFVVMEIAQTADNLKDSTKIDGNDVPIITKREMKAQIAMPSRSTIVLGGLVSNERRKSRAKVPVLGDIPILGTIFRYDKDTDNRTELLVLLTPYVLTTPEETRRETERLHNSTAASQAKWYRGWSDSPLTQPSKAQRDAEKRAQTEAERQARLDDKVRKLDAGADGSKPRISVLTPSETPLEPEPSVVELPRVEKIAKPAESAASTSSEPIASPDAGTAQAETATNDLPITPLPGGNDPNERMPLRQ